MKHAATTATDTDPDQTDNSSVEVTSASKPRHNPPKTREDRDLFATACRLWRECIESHPADPVLPKVNQLMVAAGDASTKKDAGRANALRQQAIDLLRESEVGAAPVAPHPPVEPIDTTGQDTALPETRDNNCEPHDEGIAPQARAKHLAPVFPPVSTAPRKSGPPASSPQKKSEPDLDDDLESDDKPGDDADEEDADDAGRDRDNKPAGVDPEDSRGLEAQLEGIVSHLTEDASKLGFAMMLRRGKDIYETLHPETKHGGDRSKHLTKDGTWPSFANYVAQQTGIAASTVYVNLKKGEDLESLDSQAEEACYGTPLANKPGLVARIARIPQKEVQRDIVNVYKSAGAKKSKAELARWEETFKLGKPEGGKGDKEEHDPTAQLTSFVAKVAADVKVVQEFLLGFPLPVLWKRLASLVETQLKTGTVPPESLADILARRELNARIEKLRKVVETDTDVAPTAAGKPYFVCSKTLDEAIANPKLTVRDVQALDAAWAEAVAHVGRKTPGETVLGAQPRKQTKASEPKAEAPAPTMQAQPKADSNPERAQDSVLRSIHDGARGLA